VVYYDERAAADGCAIDFVTNNPDLAQEIQFKASVWDQNKPDDDDKKFNCVASEKEEGYYMNRNM
jgi:hypothetical protein